MTYFRWISALVSSSVDCVQAKIGIESFVCASACVRPKCQSEEITWNFNANYLIGPYAHWSDFLVCTHVVYLVEFIIIYIIIDSTEKTLIKRKTRDRKRKKKPASTTATTKTTSKTTTTTMIMGLIFWSIFMNEWMS